jgi:osmotically-inducible protein OsmY
MKLRVSYILPFALALLIALPVQAEEDEGVMAALKDARLEGQLWSAYALNQHLSAFDISVDVEAGTATLTGTVDESVQKDLAKEIALSTDGIDDVDNQLEVADHSAERESVAEADRERGFGDRVSDATVTTTVKSKLLWNRNTAGLDINVSTRNGEVTLEGEAESEASRELAERLAANTDGVRSVDNRIEVSGEADEPAAGAAAEGERGFTDTVSDGWVTTKVRSTLLFSTDVPGQDIAVETRNGVVRLEGKVSDPDERERAIALAADIEGVQSVEADALVVEGS